MRGVSTLRAKGTCDRPVALATMNTIERIFGPRRDFDTREREREAEILKKLQQIWSSFRAEWLQPVPRSTECRTLDDVLLATEGAYQRITE